MEAAGCEFDRLDSAVESFRGTVADFGAKPSENTVESSLDHLPIVINLPPPSKEGGFI